MNIRKTTSNILNTLAVAATAFMIWRAASIITNTESPIVSVLSGSMRPGFDRGDLLLLTLSADRPVQVNDICVFKLPGKDVPIVHRVIKVHQSTETGKEYILTKGDNNTHDDRKLYPNGMMWIHRENIVGTVQGIVPYVGLVSIWISEVPWLKPLRALLI